MRGPLVESSGESCNSRLKVSPRKFQVRHGLDAALVGGRPDSVYPGR